MTAGCSHSEQQDRAGRRGRRVFHETRKSSAGSWPRDCKARPMPGLSQIFRHLRCADHPAGLGWALAGFYRTGPSCQPAVFGVSNFRSSPGRSKGGWADLHASYPQSSPTRSCDFRAALAVEGGKQAVSLAVPGAVLLVCSPPPSLCMPCVSTEGFRQAGSCLFNAPSQKRRPGVFSEWHRTGGAAGAAGLILRIAQITPGKNNKDRLSNRGLTAEVWKHCNFRFVDFYHGVLIARYTCQVAWGGVC